MDFEVIIIGGGVVGLACARESSTRGFSTLLIERHDSFGQETSSRNSEVIHSGIYYVTDSLKAKLCVAGNRRMYEECERLGVWYNRCGKFVVAISSEEEPELEKLYKRGIANGVEGLQLLTVSQVATMEPHIKCRMAMHVPGTGIVDSHELMRAYMHEAKERGADIAFGIECVGAERKNEGFQLFLRQHGNETEKLTARFVINAAGLSADKVAKLFGIDIDAAGYRLHPNRGHYYRVASSKNHMITRLIYPVPNPQIISLGIHVGLDKSGQCRLGPDAEYLDGSISEKNWYNFDDSDKRREKFYNAASRYFPALSKEDLLPDQVGVRAKVQAPGEPLKDFIIQEESKRGLPGLVNLVGIESPGLTSSAEIAREVFSQISLQQ